MNQNKQPIFNIEETTPIYVAVILVVIHALMQVVSPGLQAHIGNATALVAINGNPFFGDRALTAIPTLLTHILIHSDWMHVILNSAFIAIFGIFIVRATRNSRGLWKRRIQRGNGVFLLVFLAGSIAGGLGQWALWFLESMIGFGGHGNGIAVGASSGGSALFVAAGYALGGQNLLKNFFLIGVLMSVIFIIVEMASPQMGGVAWAAHLGGMVFGYWIAPKVLVAGGANTGGGSGGFRRWN